MNNIVSSKKRAKRAAGLRHALTGLGWVGLSRRQVREANQRALGTPYCQVGRGGSGGGL